MAGDDFDLTLGEGGGCFDFEGNDVSATIIDPVVLLELFEDSSLCGLHRNNTVALIEELIQVPENLGKELEVETFTGIFKLEPPFFDSGADVVGEGFGGEPNLLSNFIVGKVGFRGPVLKPLDYGALCGALHRNKGLVGVDYALRRRVGIGGVWRSKLL